MKKWKKKVNRRPPSMGYSDDGRSIIPFTYRYIQDQFIAYCKKNPPNLIGMSGGMDLDVTYDPTPKDLK